MVLMLTVADLVERSKAVVGAGGDWDALSANIIVVTAAVGFRRRKRGKGEEGKEEEKNKTTRLDPCQGEGRKGKKRRGSFTSWCMFVSYSSNPVHKKSQKQPPADLPQFPTQLSWLGFFAMPHTASVSTQQSAYYFFLKKSPSGGGGREGGERGDLALTVVQGAFNIAVAP